MKEQAFKLGLFSSQLDPSAMNAAYTVFCCSLKNPVVVRLGSAAI